MSPMVTGLRPAQRPLLADLWRRVAARLLRRASDALARQAREVARPLHERQRRLPSSGVVEFHAEAGAPEGALYVDGELVGYLDVRRL